MKDNPLAQAVREKSASPQPVDMGRLMQMVEEIHQAIVQQVPMSKPGKIVTTQQSHS